MIRKTALFGASLAALAFTAPAIAGEHDVDPVTGIELLVDEAETEAPATPTMSFGTWGVDPELLSDTVEPGEDFFAYVNQEWLDANPLPAEFSRFGAFNLLREKSTTDVKALMDELTAKDPATLSGDERRIVDMYNSFLDTDAIETAGLAPFQPYIDALATVSSREELAMLWAEPGYSARLADL